jgi:hypothetical protein
MASFEDLRGEILDLHSRYTQLFVDQLRRLSSIEDGQDFTPVEQEENDAERIMPEVPSLDLLGRAERIFSPGPRRTIWSGEETNRIKDGLKMGLDAKDLLPFFPGKHLDQIASKIKRVRNQNT